MSRSTRQRVINPFNPAACVSDHWNVDKLMTCQMGVLYYTQPIESMKIDLYQVDAFTNAVFKGNPAAVCLLQHWLDDQTLQSVAMENNLSETAFIVPVADGYHIRWFTPTVEVDLCGHATLASAHVIWQYLGETRERIRFESKSGDLAVFKTEAGRYTLDFPSSQPTSMVCPDILKTALGVTPLETSIAEDCVVLLESEEAVRHLSPDFSLLSQFVTRGVLVTARGNDCDFVSRCFFPRLGVAEDPVTGSAHCVLVPYWAQKLNKSTFFCKQISARGGELWCELRGQRVEISGQCVLYLRGQIEI